MGRKQSLHKHVCGRDLVTAGQAQMHSTRGVSKKSVCGKIINKINLRALGGEEESWLPRLSLGLS